MDHSGVDYRSMGARLVQGLTTESLRGASTITMQLASLLNRELQPKKGEKINLAERETDSGGMGD